MFKSINRSQVICYCLTFILFPLAVSAQESNQWQSLFNGKNLNGWKQLNGKARYEVINGEIVGTTVSTEPNSFLATEKNYGDFILELELFVDPTMNSGIQFRSRSMPDYKNGKVHGYQAEVDPSARQWSGGIYDESRRGWLYTMEYNPNGKLAFKNGQWNKYRIECVGNVIRTWINGVATAYLVDAATSNGFIALQVHAIGKNDEPGKQIRWRNIRIKTTGVRASSTTPIFVVNTIANQLSSQEKANGYTLLFDGKTTKGWRGAYQKNFPTAGWKIADGLLSVERSDGKESVNGGDIVTEKEYAAFELQFDFRLTEGANSGVKYFVTETEGNKGSAIGLEYQILDDAKHPDAKLGKNGNRTLGAVYDLITAKKVAPSLRKIGEWNHGMIRTLADGRVTYWLNGYQIVDFFRNSPEFKALVAESKYQQWPAFGAAKSGHILLQDHGDEVSFRSIKIRELN